ncbi:MAG TPA: histidine kinase, partial [Chloroflexota bacterium]|nr:histidine kinase [Chloroflexota bacterium]
MIQAQEEDRRRVAYDIHDGLAQMMVSAHQHLQTFGMLHGRQDARADEALARGLFMMQKSIEEVRKVIAGLRPAELDDLGLIPALQLYVQSLRDDLGWQLDLVDEVGPQRLPATVEVTTYRIVQEALNNARRHGNATRARVEIRRDSDGGGTLHLFIQDWGQGFDTDALDDGLPK